MERVIAVSEEKRRQPRLKRLLIACCLFLAVGTGGFFLFVSDYYPADAGARALLAEDDIHRDGRITELAADSSGDAALIFYPGAKVDADAYLPLLDRLRDTGLTCYLIEMPLRLAVFDSDAALDVIAAHPDVRHWYIGGHSLGGAMASKFASAHADAVDGLLLLGAYRYGDYPAEQAIIIYGSLNESIAEHVAPDDCAVVIEGGNHAQFGNYGPQKGDVPATISADEQQEQAVAAMEAFIEKHH